MFYLFILTGIVVNTLYTLSTLEILFSWIVILAGYLVVDYMNIIKDMERSKEHFQATYSQKMEEIREQLISAQIQKTKQIADQAAKSKSGK